MHVAGSKRACDPNGLSKMATPAFHLMRSVEEDFGFAMDRSALTPIGPLPNRDAISKAPRAAGYRGSDFGL